MVVATGAWNAGLKQAKLHFILVIRQPALTGLTELTELTRLMESLQKT